MILSTDNIILRSIDVKMIDNDVVESGSARSLVQIIY